eukprot:s5140_g3.t1
MPVVPKEALNSKFHFPFVAMGRAKPDPSVSVSDLQFCFEKLLKREATWDLAKILLSWHGSLPGWKNAADASYLSSPVGGLCQDLFKVDPQGVFSSKKLKTALAKLSVDKQKRINFSKYPDSVFHDKIDTQVRIACSQCRDLKRCSSNYARCIRKASMADKAQIDAVLQCLKVDLDDIPKAEGGEAQTSQGQVDKSPMNFKEPASPTKSFPIANVYKRVLEKKDSEASTPSRRLRTKTKASEAMGTSLALVPAPESPPNLPGSFKDSKEDVGLRRQNAFVVDIPLKRQNAFVEDEEQELLMWMQQKATVKKVSKKKKKATKVSKDNGKGQVLKKPAAKKSQPCQVAASAKNRKNDAGGPDVLIDKASVKIGGGKHQTYLQHQPGGAPKKLIVGVSMAQAAKTTRGTRSWWRNCTSTPKRKVQPKAPCWKPGRLC